jgi:two-component system sensor histidine kinase DesK
MKRPLAPWSCADEPAQLAERVRLGGRGWRRWLFPGIWLVYLAQTVDDVGTHSSGADAVIGYAIIVAFALCYLTAISAGWSERMPYFWFCYAAGFALTVAEVFFAHDGAFVFLVYQAVLTVAAFRQYAAPIVAAMALVTLVGPHLAPGDAHGLDYSGALAVVLVGLAMYGFFAIIQSNRDLAAARAEVARLAAENERTRIARDLHDLLGHSLTTITVKAGLARRLAERGEHGRSADEIAEVEQLARRTLGDVRAAVSGHREVTLAGELATAREVLRATGIVAELPGSVDIVDPTRSELFGWVVREAVTNVVRHSRAAHCRIALGREWIEVVDDGRGGDAAPGSGLQGLTERVSAAGGRVRVGTLSPGWRVHVDMAARPQPAQPPSITVAP